MTAEKSDKKRAVIIMEDSMYNGFEYQIDFGSAPDEKINELPEKYKKKICRK